MQFFNFIVLSIGSSVSAVRKLAFELFLHMGIHTAIDFMGYLMLTFIAERRHDAKSFLQQRFLRYSLSPSPSFCRVSLNELYLDDGVRLLLNLLSKSRPRANLRHNDVANFMLHRFKSMQWKPSLSAPSIVTQSIRPICTFRLLRRGLMIDISVSSVLR